MSVKVIPVSAAYRENWERVFRPRGSDDRVVPGVVRGDCRVIGPVVWPFDGAGGMFDLRDGMTDDRG